MPFWRASSGGEVGGILYSGTSGKWIIGGKEVEDAKFDTTMGWIRNPEEHGGTLPHMMGKSWQLSDGNQWLDEGSLKISPSPSKSQEGPDFVEQYVLTKKGGGLFCLAVAKLFVGRLASENDWSLDDVYTDFKIL